jgi:hypothetical protein
VGKVQFVVNGTLTDTVDMTGLAVDGVTGTAGVQGNTGLTGQWDYKGQVLLGGKTYIYNDLFSKFEDKPRYSERLTGTTDYESVVVGGGTLSIYQGPGSDLSKYYIERGVMACRKL